MSRSGQSKTADDAGADTTIATHRAPAVAKAAAVLRLLAGERTGIGVSEIARRSGLVPSTCLHILRALADEGFITFDPEKKTYRTGVGLLTLVRGAIATSDYPRVVQPVLDSLSSRHNVTAIAVELDNRNRMVVVALSRADSLISLHVNIGSRYPAYLSATGRCVAAESDLSKDQLRAEFDRIIWQRAPRFEEWHADVERARLDGIAIDYGNNIRGITVVAKLVPKGTDRMMRAIALVGFDSQLTEKPLQQIKLHLDSAVAEVSSHLH